MIGTLASAAQIMGGVLHGGDAAFDGVNTDTRGLSSGQLFFALRGPNFDGQEFIAQARSKRAAGSVVHKRVASDLPQIIVGDTRLALGQLAAAWRQEQSATIVAITGSNGKTTLKELTAACLRQKLPTIATEGNLNNDIGLPLMLSRIDARHRMAVIEMGANHAGEIAYLTSLAKPDVVAISNAAAAHLEGFKTIEGVARAKAEILCGNPRPRLAVLNADDRWFGYWMSLVEDIETLSFGLQEDADIRGMNIETGVSGTRFDLQLPDTTVTINMALSGIHNVSNACAAAAIATSLGVSAPDIVTAFESVRAVSGRLQVLTGINGATLYDDSYNANPLSVVSAAQYLATLPGEAWFVLGDMGELGPDASAMHRDVGTAIQKAGVKRLFALGELSRESVEAFGVGAAWFESSDALIDAVRSTLTPQANVLVKGSRFMRMEVVVAGLVSHERWQREA